MAGRLKSLENRIANRMPIRVMVEYERVDDFLADYSANVSLGGMFIETEDPLQVGTRFRLRLRVPERTKPVETYGEVRWVVSKESNGTTGMGIQFDVLAPKDRKTIKKMIVGWDVDEE